MRLLQRWQFPSQAEQSLSAELDTCQSYGFDGVIAKAMDGQWWMGDGIDNSPDALSSVDQVAAQAQAAHDRGLQFFTWINPRQSFMGPDAAILTGDIADACDGLAFDTEPYDGFLGAYPPVGLCRDFMAVVRQRSPGSTLIWQPDPRPNALAAVREEEWAPFMSVYAPQDYVSDFYFTPTASLMAGLLTNTRAKAEQYGIEPWTTLPGNADQSVLPADQIELMSGFIVWRIGSTPSDNLRYIGGIAMSQDPADPCAGVQGQVDGLITTIADISDRVVVDGLTAALQHTTVSKKTIRGIIAQVQAEREQAIGPRPAGVRGPARRSMPYGNMAEGSNEPPK